MDTKIVFLRFRGGLPVSACDRQHLYSDLSTHIRTRYPSAQKIQVQLDLSYARITFHYLDAFKDESDWVYQFKTNKFYVCCCNTKRFDIGAVTFKDNHLKTRLIEKFNVPEQPFAFIGKFRVAFIRVAFICFSSKAAFSSRFP